MRAANCDAFLPGSVVVEYPGFDVQPTTAGLGNSPAEDADACLEICLVEVAGCNSAVFVTNYTTNTRTCYYKSGSVTTRTAASADRFVAVGCEAPPAEGEHAYSATVYSLCVSGPRACSSAGLVQPRRRVCACITFEPATLDLIRQLRCAL